MKTIKLTKDMHAHALAIVGDVAEDAPLNSTPRATLRQLQAGRVILVNAEAERFLKTVVDNAADDFSDDEMPTGLRELHGAVCV